VRAFGQRAAVRARLVERVEHEVDQVAKAVGHRRTSWRLIAFDVSLDRRPAGRQAPRMPSWSEFEAAAPELAASVRRRLDAHTHKTLATVRGDGSPRISGTESRITHGELWIGSMWDARKARDLQRDPRFALHSGSDDPPEWEGDAKLAGVVEEITDPERVRELNGSASPDGRSHLFRLDLHEVSTVGLNEARDRLVIQVWTPERGVRTIERA